MIAAILGQMPTIGLDDMKAVRLMNRVDQKYMVPDSLLEQLLGMVVDKYFVQQIEGELIAPYHTLYFDTNALAMYTMHHNQKLNRQKLRVRCYRSTNTTFFEIKNKDNNGKTSKIRIPIDPSMFEFCYKIPEIIEFVEHNTPYTFGELIPCIENRFKRITLVDKSMSERVTIDSSIAFYNRATGFESDISRVLVIEVKHEIGTPMSAVEQALHQLHVIPRRMSKYCIGTALTNPLAKYNRFKPKLLYIDKITNL